jgi:putative two-component system response regulator
MQKEIVQNSKVLIVDDQAANIELLVRILRHHGFQYLHTFTDPRRVAPLFQDIAPDLVLLDLRMPHLDGLLLFKQLRSQIPEGAYLPFLVLTADQSDRAKKEALSLGAKDFLTKPFDQMEVVLRSYNLLETRFLHLELQRHNHTLEQKVQERTRELRETQVEILRRLALAAEYRDDETGQHTQRVGRLAARLAQEAGLPEQQVQLIREAAPLHDLGKIGISDNILLKPGKLTPEEYEIIKGHTQIGARILSGDRFPLLKMAEQIALYHHECWDGSGYLGLRGEAIPLVARIVGIADAFDVITHNRPYKSAQSVEVAVEEIRKGSGGKFDPALAAAFLRLLESKDLQNLDEALQSGTAQKIDEQSLKPTAELG